MKNDLVKSNLEYYYYDKYVDKPDELECEGYRDINKIKELGMKFDCVILMNVLHEIDVLEWEQTFIDIKEILKEEGYLLIFEVKSLLHGEQPYGKSGFILLEEEQINILFGTKKVRNIKINEKEKTNLFVVSEKFLKNVTLDSVKNAICSLKNSLYYKLKKEYEEKRNIAHNDEIIGYGSKTKKYGFLSQHYINVILAYDIILNELNKKIINMDNVLNVELKK